MTNFISVMWLDALFQNIINVISVDVCTLLSPQRFAVCDQNPAGWRPSFRFCNTDRRFSRAQRSKQTSKITSSTRGDRLAIPLMFINCGHIISLIQTDSIESTLASSVCLKRDYVFFDTVSHETNPNLFHFFLTTYLPTHFLSHQKSFSTKHIWYN
jgi:hypothetical protein